MNRRVAVVCFALAAACLIVFGQAARFGFLNFDDNAYVTENPWVRGGFSTAGILWAFHSIGYFYWQPLTWLSHMLDCQLFGLEPGWHHLVNVLYHTANSVLVFLIFRRLSGAFWRSAVLAALFALHPLRLESVVWIAERKDVLSTFWFLVTLLAYIRFAERPSGPHYLAVLAAFACGLMAKPMLMMTPVLLLLLDYWPLRRRAFAEKLPLFAMAGVTLAVTWLGTRQTQSINWAANLPFSHRAANAMVSYAAYLGLTLWPHHLSILYPYRVAIAAWKPAAAAALLAGVTWAVLGPGRKRRYLVFGWLWFVIGMLPPIGLVQVGRQAMADRFTYIPFIGLGVMAVWGLADLLERRRALAGALACAAIVPCAAASLAHIGTWRDSVTVFRNAVAATSDNSAAQHYLAAALDERGRFAEALPHHAEAVRIEPSFFLAQFSYGLALDRQGDAAAAVEHYAQAVRYFPDYGEARYHMGLDLARLGRTGEARAQFEQAIQNGLDEEQAADARRRLQAL